jgi:hypothetical protein
MQGFLLSLVDPSGLYFLTLSASWGFLLARKSRGYHICFTETILIALKICDVDHIYGKCGVEHTQIP